MLKHGGGEVGDNRECLRVQVTEDGVGFPTPDELDDIGVDVAAKEGQRLHQSARNGGRTYSDGR